MRILRLFARWGHSGVKKTGEDRGDLKEGLGGVVYDPVPRNVKRTFTNLLFQASIKIYALYYNGPDDCTAKLMHLRNIILVK